MKKALLFSILFCVLPRVAQAGVALVQHASKDAGTTTSSSLAFSSNNTLGNFIAVCVRAGHSGEVFTITDSKGNSYRQAAQMNETLDTPNGDTLAIFYAENITAGANTVTVSDTISATLRFAILEYSGVARANSLDVTATAQGNSASPNSGNATTTASGDLLLGAVITANAASFTVGRGYIIRESVPAEPSSKLIAEDQIQTSAGTASAIASLGASDKWGAALATFKAALPPAITSLSPAAGAVGASVTITGTNLGASQENSTVTFNASAATPTSWSSTQVLVPVPSGASTGNVVVTVSGLTSNAIPFTVTTPAAFAASAVSLNTARDRHSATVLNNGLVLIAGGLSGSGQPLTSAELYNPATGTFTATGSLNTPRWDHTATLLANGKVLIAGGINYDPANNFSAGDSITSAELYDPATGMFTPTGSMNTWRVHHTATLLPNGQVLIAGGFGNDDYNLASPFTNAELYNPATGTFTVTASLNTGRGLHSATLVYNGTKYVVLIAGGYNGNAAVSSAELYDPGTGTFSTTGSLGTARNQHTATLLNNGYVLIAGGSGTFNSTTALASAELYNPTTGAFTSTVNQMSSARYFHTATLLNNGIVLVAGGYIISGGGAIATADLYSYSPAGGNFTATGNLSTGRGAHTATLLGTGMVLLAGGYSTAVLASAELYQPSSLSLANLTSIALTPASPSVAVGGFQSFTATGTFSDSSTQALASAAWSSSNPSIATVSNDSGNFGQAEGVSAGSTTISACNGSICGSTTATVNLQPAITALSPSAGSVGTSVTITGTNFGSTQGSSTVSFHGTTATPTSWSATQIVAPVPSGTTTGNAAVTVSGLASNGIPFTVTTAGGFAASAVNLNAGRYFHTATVLNNGQTLIVGGTIGSDSNNKPIALTNVELYNPATGTFTTTGSLVTGRYNHTATLLPNGMVLILGGNGYGGTALPSAELYNPATGTFMTAVGNLNAARYYHTATLLANGSVLIVGGTNGSTAVSVAEIYNPATGTFTLTTGNPVAARYYHTATLLSSGSVLIAGGTNGSSVLTSAELYNPATGTFTGTGSLATARYQHTASLLNNGKVLVAGGNGSSNTLNSAELYDPAAGTFGTTGAMTTARVFHTATLLSNGQVLVAGGYVGGSLTSAELYDPTAPGTFGSTGSFNTGRGGQTATLLSSGLVLMAGGYNGGALTSVELYQPRTVAPANLVSIAVSPANPSVASGGFKSFTATGTFNGSSTQTLGSVVWSSSNTSIATISNDASNYGTANAINLGSTTIKACAGTICGSTTLTVNSAPVIGGISPWSGAVGASVTITGTDFGTTQGTSTVAFNGTTATPATWSATSIVAPVPTGATTGNVVVTVTNTASNGVPFTVTPTVTSLTVLAPNGTVLVSSIANNQSISSSQLGTQGWTIRANTTGSPSEVIFTPLNVNTHTAMGSPYPYTSSSSPFTVCSSSDCSGYFAVTSSCGNTYLLQAVPYVLSGGEYVAGTPYTIAFSLTSGTGIAVAQDPGGNNITITPPSGDNEIVIDDGPNFSTPVLDQTFTGSSISISNIQSSGLVQGVMYNFKSKPSGTTAACVIEPTKWNVALPRVDYLDQIWSGAIRNSLMDSGLSGLMSYSSPTWSVNSGSSNGAAALAALRAPNYAVGTFLESNDQTWAVNEIQQHFNLTQMDELAQYYDAFLTSTASVTLYGNSQPTTLGALVMKLTDIDAVGHADQLSTVDLDGSYVTCSSTGCSSTGWPTGARTMVYSDGSRLQECPLCNQIFFFPAAKLVRLVSTVPQNQRTTNMTNFVRDFIAQNPTSFLVDDQVLRSVYNSKDSLGGCATYLPGLPDPTNVYSAWTYGVANYSNRSTSSLECFSMFNNHLYLIGAAAEILGANANDSTLVPLSGSYTCKDSSGNLIGSTQFACLQGVVRAGISLFKLKQNNHPTTDFNGQSASAVSYFDGDDEALGSSLLDDSAFACYSSSTFPTTPCNLPGSSTNSNPLVSWDNSHYYILPVFLRTLFDNKKVINSLTSNFPAATDLQYAVQQLVYNVMQNHTQASGRQYPVFSNYMDGTDGWYRVGYHGPNFGYAPGASCDARAANPPQSGNGPWPCLTAFEVVSGWGTLTPFSSDLNLIQQNLISLAQATDTTSKAFRDLHYYSPNANLPFSFYDANQNIIYPQGILGILYLSAAQVQ